MCSSDLAMINLNRWIDKPSEPPAGLALEMGPAGSANVKDFMLRPADTSTNNAFSLLVGNGGALKWDPLWNFLHWLALPNQAHGLGTEFQSIVTDFAFGRRVTGETAQEHRVDGEPQGAGKWADFALGAPSLNAPTNLLCMDDLSWSRPGDARKIDNLA